MGGMSGWLDQTKVGSWYEFKGLNSLSQADPAEAHPLYVTPQEKAHYEGLLLAKLHDIQTTMRSEVDYTKREDPSAWPCCSMTQPDCACDTWATAHQAP